MKELNEATDKLNKPTCFPFDKNVMSLVTLCYHCVFLDSGLYGPELLIEERRRRDKGTPRIAIRKHPHSAFQCVCGSGNDQALLNCCGVDHLVFNKLLQLFKPAFDTHMPDRMTGTVRKLKFTKHGKRRRKPREINALGSLRLILFWFRTRGSSARSVAQAFG